jgi:uncharacterized protein
MEVLSLFLLVFMASLFGSLHCGGMCGPLFLALRLADAWKYHLSRLVGYLLLSSVASWLGSLLFEVFPRSFVSVGVTGLTSFYFIAAGLFILMKKASMGVSWGHQFFLFLSQKLGTSPYAMGFVSCVLPCGWLYTFLAAALVAATPWHGLVLMFAFWLGTVPVFHALGHIQAWVRLRLPQLGARLAGFSLIMAGILTLLIRLTPLKAHILKPLSGDPSHWLKLLEQPVPKHIPCH